MGLFDSGLDVSGWGVPEFVIAGTVAYFSIDIIGGLFSSFSLGRGVKQANKRRRSASLRRRAA
jgi:hypothetical protein